MAAALLLLAAALPRAATAHGPGLSYLDLHVDGDTVQAALDVPASELFPLLALDADEDGLAEPEDIEVNAARLSDWLIRTVRLSSGGEACRGTREGALLRDGVLVTVAATYRCPGEVQQLELKSRLLQQLGDGHTTFVRAVRGDIEAQQVLTLQASSAQLDLSRDNPWSAAGRFWLLGVEHIFTGIDHVLFLLALLLIGGSLGRIIAIATAFTVAHSITLSLAALGLVSLPSQLVESAIALSIGYVALENFAMARRRAPGEKEPLALRLRWVLTFAFGLIHGFGFAGVLGELGLPREHLVVSLAAFNLGVEAGQVAIVAAAWPLLRRAEQSDWYRPAGVRFASVGVFVIACYWFAERAFGL